MATTTEVLRSIARLPIVGGATATPGTPGTGTAAGVRTTHADIMADIQLDLYDSAGHSFSTALLNSLFERVNREVSGYMPNQKRMYVTTVGQKNEIDLTDLTNFIGMNWVVYPTDSDEISDSENYRNVKMVLDRIFMILYDVDPTRVIVAITDGGTGTLNVTLATAPEESFSASDWITITGSTSYNGNYELNSYNATTKVANITGTYGANEAGYIGEQVRIYYNAIHSLDDTISTNTMSFDAERIFKMGVVAYACLDYVNRMHHFIHAAEGLIGSGRSVLNNMDSHLASAATDLANGANSITPLTDVTTAIDAAISHLASGLADIDYSHVRAAIDRAITLLGTVPDYITTMAGFNTHIAGAETDLDNGEHDLGALTDVNARITDALNYMDDGEDKINMHTYGANVPGHYQNYASTMGNLARLELEKLIAQVRDYDTDTGNHLALARVYLDKYLSQASGIRQASDAQLSLAIREMELARAGVNDYLNYCNAQLGVASAQLRNLQHKVASWGSYANKEISIAQVYATKSGALTSAYASEVNMNARLGSLIGQFETHALRLLNDYRSELRGKATLPVPRNFARS